MSYQEKMEGLQRRADIASSRANPERRQMAKDSMRNFFGKLFNRKDSNAGRQYFGSSPLQQAIAQRDSGNLTDAGARLLSQYEQNAPDEISRQQAMMPSQRHGDYGRVPMQMESPPASSINPSNSQPIEDQDLTTTAMPKGVEGPVVKKDTSNVSEAVANKDMDTLGQQQLMQKMMQDPSKLSAKGIAEMQQMLNNLGFKDKDGNALSVNGKMDALTVSAMENWKASVPNPSSMSTGEPLAPVKVVSGFNQNNVAGAEEGAFSPKMQWNPYAMEMQSQWDIVNQGHGGIGQQAGYQDIQQTFGNPENDPMMFGTDDFRSSTNPLQYDLNSGEVFDPYK